MDIDDTMLCSDGFIVWLLSVSKQAQCTQTDGWKRDRDPDSPSSCEETKQAPLLIFQQVQTDWVTFPYKVLERYSYCNT